MSSKKIVIRLSLILIPLFVFLLNFPYPFGINDFLYGYPGDKTAAVWDLWWRRNAASFGASPDFSPLLMAPWGVSLSSGLDQNMFFWLQKILSYLPFINETGVFNLIFLITIITAFFSTYYLILKLTKNFHAALTSGLIYSSSLYLMWHSMQNLEISLASSLLPFLVWSLVLLEEKMYNSLSPGFIIFSALRVSVTFSVIFLLSFYIGFFALIFMAGYFLVNRLQSNTGDRFFHRKVLIPVCIYSLSLLLSLVFILPSTWAFFNYTLGSRSLPSAQLLAVSLNRNTISDLIAYGARPWDYLMPSIYHPFFGSFVRQIYEFIRQNASYQFWSTFFPERPNYLTLTGLGLTALAVIDALHRKKLELTEGELRRRRLIITFVILAVWMFLVSLPPMITIKGNNFYLPSYFFFNIFPMFRVYSRAGVFVLLMVVILSGYGIKKLEENLGFRKRLIIFSFFVFFVIFENLNGPPFSAVLSSSTPEVYRWLRDRKENILIIEYPKDNSEIDIDGGCPSWLDSPVVRDWNIAYETYYQTYHRKSTFGYRRLPKEERALIGDLKSPETYKILRQYGVTTVVVHTKDPMIGIYPFPYPQENPLDECWQRRVMKAPEKVYEKFIKVAEFDDGVVYSVQ